MSDKDEEEYRALLEANTKAPVAMASVPATATSAPKITTADAAKAAKEALTDTENSDIAAFLNDPRNVGALGGSAVAAWRSGASFNPLNPAFLQYNERYPNPHDVKRGLNAYTASQVLSDVGESGIDVKALSKASGMPVRTMAEAQAAIEAIKAREAARSPVTKMVNGVPTAVRYIQSAGKETTPLTAPSMIGRVGTAVSEYLPGVKAATDWVKGALPTAGKVLGGANMGLQAVDVGTRAYGGDTTGAAISGVGAVAPWLLGPQIGAPVALGTLAVNYLRDHPEALARYKRNIAAQVELPPPSTDPMGNYVGASPD